jgi:hypothetical protein
MYLWRAVSKAALCWSRAACRPFVQSTSWSIEQGYGEGMFSSPVRSPDVVDSNRNGIMIPSDSNPGSTLRWRKGTATAVFKLWVTEHNNQFSWRVLQNHWGQTELRFRSGQVKRVHKVMPRICN